MARLILLLCLTAVLSAICARGTRLDIAGGRGRNAVDRDPGRGNSFGRFGDVRRRLLHGSSRWRQRFDSESGPSAFRRRQGLWREDRGPGDGMHEMRRMPRPLSTLGREGGRRMVERLRQELSRFRSPGAGRRGQGRDQGRRRFHPDARASFEMDRQHQGVGAAGFFDPRLDLMEHGRGSGRRHPGNNLWGQGGGRDPTRVGHGGHHRRGPHRSGFGHHPVV